MTKREQALTWVLRLTAAGRSGWCHANLELCVSQFGGSVLNDSFVSRNQLLRQAPKH